MTAKRESAGLVELLERPCPPDSSTRFPQPSGAPLRELDFFMDHRELIEVIADTVECLRRGAPREEELEQVRDLVFELAVGTWSGKVRYQHLAAGLLDLLRRGDSDSARQLADLLEVLELGLRHEEEFLDTGICLAQAGEVLSREQMARLAGVKPETVDNWRRGRMGALTAEYTIRPLARTVGWLRRAGLTPKQARSWIFERRHPALGCPPADSVRGHDLRLVADLALGEALRARGIAATEKRVCSRLGRVFDASVVGPLEGLAEELEREGPFTESWRADVLERVLELITSIPEPALNLRRIFACLGDLVRFGDTKSAKMLASELRSAAFEVEESCLPEDRRGCLELVDRRLGLSDEETAQLCKVKPQSVRRWRRQGKRDSGRASRRLRRLASIAHWLGRAGLDRAEARSWLCEETRSWLGMASNLTPAQYMTEYEGHDAIAMQARAEARRAIGLR